jgi:hypothetical protein
MKSLCARCGAITAGCEQRVRSKNVAGSRLGFLLLTRKVERQWRQLCCLGWGGVQQEKLLLHTNKFCRQFKTDPGPPPVIATTVTNPAQDLYSLERQRISLLRFADEEVIHYVRRTNGYGDNEW